MLSKVVALNFQSFSELEYNVSSGVTLIDGWNEDDQTQEGAGKSAIPNAIAWCLYGKLPKDAKIDDVIKHGASSCSVAVQFSNQDIIVRSRKPNDLYLQSKGQVIKGKDLKETQELIEEYLGCNFETYCQSTYFAQNYDKKFLMSNQEDKGKILSSIQNLQVFDKARKETMDLAKKESEKIVSLKSELQVIEANQTNWTSQRQMLESFIQDKITKHQTQVQYLQTQKASYESEINKMNATLLELQGKLSSMNLDTLVSNEQQLNSAKAEWNQQLTQIRFEKSQISTVTKSIMAKESEGRLLAQRYSNLQTKKQQSSDLNSNPGYLRLLSEKKKNEDYQGSVSYANLLTKKKALEDFIQNPTKICPSCGSELKNVDVSHVQTELSGISFEMAEIAHRSATTIEAIDKDLINLQFQFSKDLEALDRDSEQILSQLNEIAKFLDDNKIPSVEELSSRERDTQLALTQMDEELRKISFQKSEISSIEQQIKLTAQSRDSNQVRLSGILSSIKDLGEPDIKQDQQKLASVSEQIRLGTEKLSTVTALKSQCETHLGRLEQLKDGFKEIKSYVFVNALNELNRRTNQYLTDLFKVQATVKFSNEEQKIETRIVLDGRETGLGLLSGGQNRRFNLAVDLALSDIVANRKTSKLNLMILDEYFKDLSEVSMEKCLDLLKSRKCPVILIEHNSIFKNIIDNVFFVRLENGTSYESRP